MALEHRLAGLDLLLVNPGGRQLITSCLLFLGTRLVSKRGRNEIISTILAAVGKGVTAKTRLMYRSNLDTRTFKKHMDFLTEKGFLRDDGDHEGHCSYHLTEMGRRFLERDRELEGMLSSTSTGSTALDQPQF